MKKTLIIMKPCYMQTNFVSPLVLCYNEVPSMYTFPTCRQEGIILLNIPAHVYTAVGTPQTVNFEVFFPQQHKLVEHFLVTFRSHHV